MRSAGSERGSAFNWMFIFLGNLTVDSTQHRPVWMLMIVGHVLYAWRLITSLLNVQNLNASCLLLVDGLKSLGIEFSFSLPVFWLKGAELSSCLIRYLIFIDYIVHLLGCFCVFHKHYVILCDSQENMMVLLFCFSNTLPVTSGW